MKLVMDLVVNHTSDEHPWFVESRSSRDNPKRDWYWWRPPAAERGSPGRADQLGVVLLRPGLGARRGDRRVLPAPVRRKQPDLNWENPEVREAVYAMMRWWLDRGVDGFRMDVINMISKDPALPDGARRRRGRSATARRTSSTGRGSTSSCRRCTARSSRARGASCSPSARCPA